jgi:hypothetical protein
VIRDQQAGGHGAVTHAGAAQSVGAVEGAVVVVVLGAGGATLGVG